MNSFRSLSTIGKTASTATTLGKTASTATSVNKAGLGAAFAAGALGSALVMPDLVGGGGNSNDQNGGSGGGGGIIGNTVGKLNEKLSSSFSTVLYYGIVIVICVVLFKMFVL